MQVTIKSLAASHRNNVLASASVEVSDSEGSFLTIHDIRVLRNKSGQVWVALSSYSVAVGRGYEYKPTVEASGALSREISAKVLDAYEARQPQSSGGERNAF